MANQESTAIKALIDIVRQRPMPRDSAPAFAGAPLSLVDQSSLPTVGFRRKPTELGPMLRKLALPLAGVLLVSGVAGYVLFGRGGKHADASLAKAEPAKAAATVVEPIKDTQKPVVTVTPIEPPAPPPVAPAPPPVAPTVPAPEPTVPVAAAAPAPAPAPSKVAAKKKHHHHAKRQAKHTKKTSHP
jgi:hypothetical protein